MVGKVVSGFPLLFLMESSVEVPEDHLRNEGRWAWNANIGLFLGTPK